MPLSKVSLTLVHYHNFVVYSVIFVAFKIYIYCVYLCRAYSMNLDLDLIISAGCMPTFI